MAKIDSFSFTERLKIPKLIGNRNLNLNTCSTDEFIDATEQAIKNNPREWILYFLISDKYMSIGRYVDALDAAKKCYELKPKDILSSHLLATVYNCLTRAALKGTREGDLLKLPIESRRAIDPNYPDFYDPTITKNELDKLGLSIEAAAAQAIRWFERSLELNPDSESAHEINQTIAVLHHRFPNL